MQNKEKEKSAFGKLIIAAIGWFILILPFASFESIGEEERLTGISWAVILTLSIIYWTLITRSTWLNDE